MKQHKMTVENMKSSNGNKVPNQFIISGYEHHGDANNHPMVTVKFKLFQSYKSAIAKIVYYDGTPTVILDPEYWDYSVTTKKYLNKFLGHSIQVTRDKIKSGEYTFADLNKGE